MKLLAIETATEACSAALYIDGEVIERFEIAPRRHAELLLPMCDGLLSEAGLTLAQLDGLAFGRGPGAFTGVRIATGIIQGMAWAADLGVVPVSSLAALAYDTMQRQSCDRVAVAIDARMNEVYWGCYEKQGESVNLLGEEAVLSPGSVSLAGTGWFATGSGWQSYAELLAAAAGDMISGYDRDRYPRASATACLAVPAIEANQLLAAEQVVPVYLRDKVAEKKK